METIKQKLKSNPELVNRAMFLELAKKDEKGIPRSTGVHRVKLLRGEEGTNKDYKTQKDVEGVWLFFDEGGMEKKYFVPERYNDKNQDDKYGKFHYLYEKFADIEEGDELEMEFVKKGLVSYVDVRKAGEKVEINEEIPVVNEDNIDYDMDSHL